MGSFLKKAVKFTVDPVGTIARAATGQSTTDYALNARNNFDPGHVFYPQPGAPSAPAPTYNLNQTGGSSAPYQRPTQTRAQMVADTIANHNAEFQNGVDNATANHTMQEPGIPIIPPPGAPTTPAPGAPGAPQPPQMAPGALLGAGGFPGGMSNAFLAALQNFRAQNPNGVPPGSAPASPPVMATPRMGIPVNPGRAQAMAAALQNRAVM